MSSNYPDPIAKIIEEFSSFPGIGPKQAQRMVFYLLGLRTEDAQEIMEAISSALGEIVYCKRCFNFAVGELCEICSNATRDEKVICVVEDPRDVSRLEKTAQYKGLYHVLGGAINNIDGVGPDNIRIGELVNRIKVKKEEITELIIATNPNSAGDYTALYISEQFKDFEIIITRPARGLPMGGDLEYADDLTLGQAILHRQNLEQNLE